MPEKLGLARHQKLARTDWRPVGKNLSWSELTDIEVTAGQSHKLEVYFSVFDVFRMFGAELEVEPVQDGETRSYQYVVELKDRYFNRGHLSPVG